jgi:hypothetical protein
MSKLGLGYNQNWDFNYQKSCGESIRSGADDRLSMKKTTSKSGWFTHGSKIRYYQKPTKGSFSCFFAANHFKRKSKDAAMGQKPDAKIEELN